MRIIIKTNTLLIAMILLSIVLITCLPAYAVAPLPNPKEVSWHISAQKATYDSQKELYIAKGNVVITGGNTRLESDYAEFSNTTREALATGHVLLISGQDTITCNSLRMNLATETGTIYQGIVFIQESNFYISGNTITKTGKETYSANQATITSCSGPTPDWKITGKNVRVTIEGYGFATHSALWAKNIPVAYTPFLAFPVKTRRQSGLLAPRITSSDRRGFEYEQPLFLALTPSSDATIYAHYMAKRGTKAGVEYRYVTSESSRGTIEMDLLNDSKTDDGTSNTSQYAYDATPSRTNSNRYWFRSKHDQKIGEDITARLDLDIVSDADYLREFQDGPTGFDTTDRMFTSNFGRDLDSYDDTTRANNLNIDKTWNRYNMSLDLNWYDNVVARRQNQEDTTLQDLPVIRFNALEAQLKGVPFYLSLDSEYRYFFRKDTLETQVRGQRMDIHPNLSLPVHLGHGITLDSRVGIGQTIWYLDDRLKDNGDPTDNGDRFFHRMVPDFTTSLSTRISRVFDTQNNFAQKIKHDITPMVTYTFIPEVDQDDLPEFNDLDRIQEENLITWSLTNRLTSKTNAPKAKKNDNDTKELSPVYREFFWLSISQDFDIKRSRDNLPRPFSDITASLEFAPFTSLTLESDTSWSPYDNSFTSKNCAIGLTSRRGDILRAEYREEEAVTESLIAGLHAVLTPRLFFSLSHEENLMDHSAIESRAGIVFHKNCWSLDFSYTDKPDDKSFAFLVNLYGIGEIGTK